MRLAFRIGPALGGLLLLAANAAGQNASLVHKAKTTSKSGAKAPAKSAAKANDSIVTVTVHANADVSGRTFTLGEIAEFQGTDKTLIAQLSAVEVGSSPLPGVSRIVYAGDITVHLRAAHLESKRVEVIAPPEMRVARLGHDISNDEITQAAIDAAQSAIKDIPNATLEPLPTNGKVTVPTGKVRIVAGAYRGLPENGLLYVPVSLIVDGKPVQTAEVALRVHRKSTVLVATRSIEPHEILTSADVTLLPTDLPSGFTQPLTDIKEAIGKRATRRLMANLPISQTALETPPAIAANDKITIEYVFGTIHITAPGFARQAGMLGETIRVQASDTNKEMQAVIVNPHTVRITDNDDNTAGDTDDANASPDTPAAPAADDTTTG